MILRRNIKLPLLPLKQTNQCDQIGKFLKLFVTKFRTKVAQILGNFWAILKKHPVLFHTAEPTFKATFFKKIGLLFIVKSGHTERNRCSQNILLLSEW